MKTKLIILSLFIIVCFNSLLAQENVLKTIIEPFQKDIIYKEKVFLHLNKSVYFTNENIWFSAYVAEDAENNPSIYTSNLHVNLIDVDGNIINKKTVFIENGKGFGDFSLNNNLTSGKYFIQGFTNYMQNFGKENRFVQEIEIINAKSKDEAPKFINAQLTNTYDIQVFPESGYLLEGAENTIGLKVLINGKGFPFSGKITDSNGDIINTFSGNKLGMGKCAFNYVENETYTAIVNINNTVQKIGLPIAIKKGVIFSLDNSDKEKVILTLKTNRTTLPTLQKSHLTLLFYRNNYISEAVSLSLINNEELVQELIFDKIKMLNGVNIVTLFNNEQPIAERKFFVDRYQDQTKILIEELSTKNDSTSFKIKTLNANLKPISSQFSVSVLPLETKSFIESQTIKTAFLLTPYIKGHIENPSFYFQRKNKTTEDFLDLLLLNQGWSTYSLEEKIKQINPIEKYKFESGFTVKGKIKKYPKGYNIGMMSKNGGLIASSEITENKEFAFENVFKYKNDSIKIALIKNDHSLVKPYNVSLIEKTTNNHNLNFIPKKNHPNPIIKDSNTSTNEDYSVSNFENYPNVEVLKQVVLKDVKTKRKRTFYDDEMDLASKRRIIASGFYDNKKVTESMEDKYLNLLHYFQQLGMVEGNCPINCILRLRKTRKSFLAPIENPIVYINDTRIDEDSHIDTFELIFMEDIDEILIN